MSDREWSEVMLEFLCLRQRTLYFMFAGSLLGLFLNVLSLTAVDPATTTRVIILLNFVGLIALGAFSGGVLWKCYRSPL
jgi:hypothetical protein